MFSLFFQGNICYGYSLEVPHRGISNEYLQHMFWGRNKKDINTFQLEEKCCIFLRNICYGYSLEAPRRGTSNEYPQHKFLWINKKNINTV